MADGWEARVDWKYYIPHTWEPGSRHPWADVWLMPADGRFGGQSAPLTIDALGDCSDPTHGSERAEFQQDALEKLGDADYVISGPEMIVRRRDFSREEFLEWVKVWIRAIDPTFAGLIAGTFEEFSTSNEHARIINRIRPEYPDASAP